MLAKAEQYLHLGYQRLLTFERARRRLRLVRPRPRHVWLTAYGLQEFNDMAKVYADRPRHHRPHPGAG